MDNSTLEQLEKTPEHGSNSKRLHPENGLDRETKNRIAYVNFIIIRFARGFKMLITEDFRYLEEYGGLDFLRKNYAYEHTQSEHNACLTLLKVCRKNGGWL
ncbi:MAG: DUF3791 domain-containing protein [Prevotellaceae bacterium]|nr:DUF3791 domain-containing protein [Prevotellaceae bacterium]